MKQDDGFYERGDSFLYAWDGQKIISYSDVYYWVQPFVICSSELVLVQARRFIFICNIRKESVDKFDIVAHVFAYNQAKQILASAENHSGELQLWNYPNKQLISEISTEHWDASLC